MDDSLFEQMLGTPLGRAHKHQLDLDNVPLPALSIMREPGSYKLTLGPLDPVTLEMPFSVERVAS